ncbi:unnamed protein product [Trichogramma brassicae]|uniref:Integrase catalytic domain-containing protein n=1 Tax=Trichogramma brassicae TaxID=86971 RepID=A0A6H5IAT4_9HYME|nr:unnamed protein product [Trichogramma brassicae]
MIDTSHLDTTELDSIDSLLQEHSDRFYLEGDELPATNVVEHKITTVDDIPVNQKQYRLPHSLREEKYFWDRLKADIQRRIQQCLGCQLKKLARHRTKQPMIITDCPGSTFDKVALDIVGPLPATVDGNIYILTMQDQLSKFCIGVPLPDATATTIADAMVKRLICTFGTPKVILTDQGRNFLSKLIQRVAKRFRIKQVRTTAFHAQSNGSLERSHHALAEFLKHYTNQESDWDQWIELATLNYNSSVQESTKHTPFEVVFGRLARLPSSQPLRECDQLPTYQGYIVNLVTKINNIKKLAYDNLLESKQKNKHYYDRKLNPVTFKVGDHVFMKKEPKTHKLDDNNVGPFEIIRTLDNYNVEIQTGKNSTKIVHSNRLRLSHITSTQFDLVGCRVTREFCHLRARSNVESLDRKREIPLGHTNYLRSEGYAEEPWVLLLHHTTYKILIFLLQNLAFCPNFNPFLRAFSLNKRRRSASRLLHPTKHHLQLSCITRTIFNHLQVNSFFIRRSDATCTTVLIRRESEREMCTRTHHEASVRKRKSFASYKETQHTGRTPPCKKGWPSAALPH